MKRCVFIIVTMLFVLSVGAQVRQEVITSAGGYNISGGLSLSWTLGETVIPTFKNGDLVLTQGFQQQLIVTTIEKNLDLQVEVKLFPIPAVEVLNIQFGTPADGDIALYIYDSQGKLVIKGMIESNMTEKQINLQNVPAGIYYLKIAKGKNVNVYKVVKL